MRRPARLVIPVWRVPCDRFCPAAAASAVVGDRPGFAAAAGPRHGGTAIRVVAEAFHHPAVRPIGESTVPKAYWINTFTAVTDPERLAAYAELAGPAMTAAGGRFLARGTAAHVFEGAGIPQRTTLIEFGDVEQAVAAYHSPAYQRALAVLGDGATREIRIVEGLD